MRLLAAIAVVATLAAGCGGSSHGSTSSPTAPPPPPPPPPGQLGPNDNGQVGSWSMRLLQGSPYTSLLIQVDYISSAAPAQAALDTLLARARARLNKPAGVTLQHRALNVPGRAVWTVQQSYDLELAQRTAYANGAQAVLYFLYLDGKSDRDSGTTKVLAWSYTGTSTAIFKQTLRSATTPLVSLQEVEQSVLVHEMGHNLGLVNLGAPLTASHQDTSHGNHCDSQSCVMYYATENALSVVLQNGGAPPSEFDASCVNDLRANGGK